MPRVDCARNLRSVTEDSVLAKILGLVLLLALPALCQGGIYVFVDSNGVRHITNRPDDPRFKRVMDTPNYAPSNGAPPLVGGFDAPPEGAWRLNQRPSHTIVPRTSQGQGGNYRMIKWGRGGFPKSRLPSRGSSPQFGHGGVLGNARPFGVHETNRRRYRPHLQRIARRHRLEPALLDAVISAESAYDPQAVSRAGAMGLMQLMPATAERFGVTRPFDPVQNIDGGAQYLRWLLDRFGQLNLALAGYNAGEGAVARHGNDIPPYPETQTYVQRVLQFYNHYRYQ